MVGLKESGDDDAMDAQDEVCGPNVVLEDLVHVRR